MMIGTSWVTTRHATAGVLAHERVAQRAQPEGDVDPALPAGRAVVELAESVASGGFVGERGDDAAMGQQVEDPELALAQPLVGDDLDVQASRRDDVTGRLHRAHVRRADDGVGALAARLLAQPHAERVGLLDTEVRQRDVHVTVGEVEPLELPGTSRIVGDVAEALSVPEQPEGGELVSHRRRLPGAPGGVTPAFRRAVPHAIP